MATVSLQNALTGKYEQPTGLYVSLFSFSYPAVVHCDQTDKGSSRYLAVVILHDVKMPQGAYESSAIGN